MKHTNEKPLSAGEVILRARRERVRGWVIDRVGDVVVTALWAAPILAFLTAVAFCLVWAMGCSKLEPPCMPSAKEVFLQEADAALEHKARRLDPNSEEFLNGSPIQYLCGYDQQKGADGFERWARVGQIRTAWSDVLWCLEVRATRSVPLSECMASAARARFSSQIVDESKVSVREQLDVASKIRCDEFGRAVDIEAEKHQLQRIQGQDWVPALIWVGGQLLQGVESMAPAPSMFLITPQSGAESACEDPAQPTPVEPTKRCTDSSGCPPTPTSSAAPGAPGGPATGSGVPDPSGPSPGGDSP